jgi:hypothetical protein
MMEVTLEFNPRSGQLTAHVSHAPDVPDELVPLVVTHFTPIGRHPLLATDPSGRIPQLIVDYLMEETIPDENKWWFEYYKCRREDQRKNAAAIAQADFDYKQEALRKLEEAGLVVAD